jgi:hypothetical protein
MKRNALLIIENALAWSGVIASYFMAFVPIVQVFAGLAAFVFSVLSIAKLIKNWSK